MNYYKAFNKDMTCRRFQYEVGETYTLDGELELCENGFHFCNILNACYHYYPNNNDTIICLVEPLGDIVCDFHDNKLATNKIKIVKQLTKEEIEKDRFIIQDGIERIGNECFANCTSLKEITIPNSVTTIGNYAFHGCTSLTSITIPESVTSIGDWAFYKCASLESITIPNSVTSIGEDAFYNTPYLSNLQSENNGFAIINGILCSYKEQEGTTEITIPNGVTHIGDWAFNYYTSLTSITIPNGVTHIGDWAFGFCTLLESITIPDSVTSIGSGAFYGCTALTIYGHKDSYAKKYAQENNIKFEEIRKELSK